MPIRQTMSKTRVLPLLLGVTLVASMALAPTPAVTQGPSEAPPERQDPTTRDGPAQADVPLIDLSVRGSPLIAGRPGSRIRATVALDAPVDDLQLRVVGFGGAEVRRLARGPRGEGTFGRSWNGKDQAGRAMPPGAYRIVATATDGDATRSVQEWVALADGKIYPRRPGFITVAVDPGHGGSFDGAVARDGTREADLNLDIALRLARMLEGAGINVVITRTTDAHVNEPPQDLTADGAIDGTDELAARPDLANGARADLYISVHNNTAVARGVGGPSTFYSDERPFSDRSKRLAQIIQASMVEALEGFGSASWSPYDHGALTYPYYVLRGYDPPRLRRPTQMPGVLSEGMFLSNPRELRLLKRPAVRQAMANAYYEAIATYLARRATHVGYALIDGTTTAVAGDPVRYRVEVRNQGNEPMRGWWLHVGALPAPSMYEGRGRAGQPLTSKRIPPLAPGQKVTLTVKVKAPAPGGEWMLLFDARDRDGKRASRIGSPMLQVPLEMSEPAES